MAIALALFCITIVVLVYNLMSPALFSRATPSEPFGVMMCIHHLMKPILSIGFVVVCAGVLYLIRKRVGNDSFKKFAIQNRFFLLVGIFGLIPSFGSGQGGRALFCANVFMLMVVLKAISSGRVYALYKIAYLPDVYLKVNYTYGDVVDPRPFQLYCDRSNHKWILLNKKYHHFPLTKIEKIGVDKYENYTKFQILSSR